MSVPLKRRTRRLVALTLAAGLIWALTMIPTDDALAQGRGKQVSTRVLDQMRALQVRKANRAYEIVNAATQLAELQRYSADRKLELSATEGPERAKRQLKRDEQFVEAMRNGAQRTLDMLCDTLRRFDAFSEENQS